MNWTRLSNIIIVLLSPVCRNRTDRIPTPNLVADLLSLEISGMQQWLLIRGANREIPVLLWLHGGPESA